MCIRDRFQCRVNNIRGVMRLEIPMPDQAVGSARIHNNDYTASKTVAQQAGLLETQGKYYAVKIAYTLGMFAVGTALLFLLTGWARVLLVAPFLAFVSVQLAFLGHDLGHK